VIARPGLLSWSRRPGPLARATTRRHAGDPHCYHARDSATRNCRVGVGMTRWLPSSSEFGRRSSTEGSQRRERPARCRQAGRDASRTIRRRGYITPKRNRARARDRWHTVACPSPSRPTCRCMHARPHLCPGHTPPRRRTSVICTWPYHTPTSEPQPVMHNPPRSQDSIVGRRRHRSKRRLT